MKTLKALVLPLVAASVLSAGAAFAATPAKAPEKPAVTTKATPVKAKPAKATTKRHHHHMAKKQAAKATKPAPKK